MSLPLHNYKFREDMIVQLLIILKNMNKLSNKSIYSL